MPKAPLTRSEQMARIRGRDTSPELALRRALWRSGIRYRLHVRIPKGGRPDLTMAADRVVVFIDGCFWHGCPDHYVRPRSGGAFWGAKLTENVARDRRQTLALEGAAWRVVRVWEHEIVVDLPRVVDRVRAALDAKGRGAKREVAWRVVLVEEIAAGRERRTLASLRDPDRRRTVEGPRLTTKPRPRSNESVPRASGRDYGPRSKRG